MPNCAWRKRIASVSMGAHLEHRQLLAGPQVGPVVAGVTAPQLCLLLRAAPPTGAGAGASASRVINCSRLRKVQRQSCITLDSVDLQPWLQAVEEARTKE